MNVYVFFAVGLCVFSMRCVCVSLCVGLVDLLVHVNLSDNSYLLVS